MYSESAPTQARDIRDASLRNKADEANKWLGEARMLLDQLEDALLGPSPRPAGELARTHECHLGLRSVLNDSSSSAASLSGRLSTLLSGL